MDRLGPDNFSTLQMKEHVFHRARAHLKVPGWTLVWNALLTKSYLCFIYCITCTLCKKLYIGETGRRLGDRFREHLRDIEKNDKNASKPVARHFYLPNHSKQHIAVCGLSLHQGSTESRRTLEQKFIFQIGTLTACSRLSVSVDDWISGRATPGSRSQLIPLVARSLFRSLSLTESLEQSSTLNPHRINEPGTNQ